MIGVEADGTKVTVTVQGQRQTYRNEEWDKIWPTLIDDILDGNPIILPEPKLYL